MSFFISPAHMARMTMTQNSGKPTNIPRDAAMSGSVFGGYLLGGVVIASGLALIASGLISMVSGA